MTKTITTIKFKDISNLKKIKLMIEDIDDVPRYSKDKFLTIHGIGEEHFNNLLNHFCKLVESNTLETNLSKNDLDLLIMIVIHHISNSTDDWYPNVFNTTLIKIYNLLYFLLSHRFSD